MSGRSYSKIAVALLVVVGLSCNLFSPQEVDPDKWYMTGEAWVIEGKKKMWKGDWEGAIKDFDRAKALKSSLSEAYFYKGKCILRLHDVDLHQVWDEINPEDNSDDVPFLYNPEGVDIFRILVPPFPIELFNYDTYEFDSYQADTLIDSVFLERKRIYDAMCQSIKLLDTIHYELKKMDGMIKRVQYESDYLIEISVKTILGIIDYNNNEKLDYDSDEKRAFRILCQDIPSLDDMEFDSLKQISKDPRDIKENLDILLQSLLQADSSYNLFKDDLINGDMDTTMAGDLGQMINNFKKIIPFFYYDDFIDNDHDSWDTNKNGKPDRMIWIDWDSDEKIDLERNGSLHIGDSAHMFPNGVDSTQPFWGLDTSLYLWVDMTDEDFSRYIFKGHYDITHEFIAGDWGVDEEILDGEDNDGDGLVDEDTRISADTLDDDGDWVNTDPSPGPDTTAIYPNSYHPTDWTSLNNNVILEITGPSTSWDSVVVDSLYTALHKALHYPIYNYYPDFPNDFQWPNLIGRFNGDYTNQTEFIGGDYGMDEEYYDSLDNDGDGLFDEDVGELLPLESLRPVIIDQLQQLGVRGN